MLLGKAGVIYNLPLWVEHTLYNQDIIARGCSLRLKFKQSVHPKLYDCLENSNISIYTSRDHPSSFNSQVSWNVFRCLGPAEKWIIMQIRMINFDPKKYWRYQWSNHKYFMECSYHPYLLCSSVFYDDWWHFLFLALASGDSWQACFLFML